MRLTVNQLRRIIKEEVGRIMEMEDGDQNKIESIEDFQTWLNNFRELDSNKKNDETLKLVSGAKWDDRKDYYDVRDGNLFLRSRLLAAIENYIGELDKLKNLVLPGKIIEVPGPLNQGPIPEDFPIDEINKNPMNPDEKVYESRRRTLRKR